MRFKFRAFDVLITFRAADEKIDMRRPIPATIATSATFLFIIGGSVYLIILTAYEYFLI